MPDTTTAPAPVSQWKLANEHADASAGTIIYDPKNKDVIVAVLLVAMTKQLHDALKAQMEKHNGNELQAIDLAAPAGTDPIDLTGAGRGYVVISSTLARANAHGAVTVFLHRAATDPSLSDKPYFYVVTEPGEDLVAKFITYLTAATYHNILPHWASYLYESGREMGLISDLPMLGEGDFGPSIRVEANDDEWAKLITAGLRDGIITF